MMKPSSCNVALLWLSITTSSSVAFVLRPSSSKTTALSVGVRPDQGALGMPGVMEQGNFMGPMYPEPYQMGGDLMYRDSPSVMGPQEDQLPLMEENDLYEPGPDELIQGGGTRRTWSHEYGQQHMMLELGTAGRPMNAEFCLWQGPNNTPQRVRAFSENGALRPVRAYVATPGDASSTQVRNVGPMEFPMRARVSPGYGQMGGGGELVAAGPGSKGPNMIPGRLTPGSTLIQGNDVITTFYIQMPEVETVQVSLQTEGLPMEALVEIRQGPGRVAQTLDVYSDDGLRKPFNAEVDLPGYGSSICIINKGPMEYPIRALVVPVYRMPGSPPATPIPGF